jgi:ribosomal-protein-alanine N-acetyltransferase
LSSAQRKSEPEEQIREMIGADIATITALEREIFPDPWPARSFVDIVEGSDWIGLVVEAAGRIVGYACILLSAGEMHLANIAVVADYRRKSVASRLMSRILEIAGKHRCAMILLEVRVSNEGARAFYEREGFAELYIRPRYYRKPLEDALVMVRYLR